MSIVPYRIVSTTLMHRLALKKTTFPYDYS